MAIPISDWSLDYVTPAGECTRSLEKGGRCMKDIFPKEPDGSQVIPMVDPEAGREVSHRATAATP